MSERMQHTNVHILGKEYRISCTEAEKELLLSSALYLDTKMREIRDNGRVIGVERIAVMAALNITHEYMKIRDENDFLSIELSERLKNLHSKMDEQLHWEEAE